VRERDARVDSTWEGSLPSPTEARHPEAEEYIARQHDIPCNPDPPSRALKPLDWAGVLTLQEPASPESWCASITRRVDLFGQ